MTTPATPDGAVVEAALERLRPFYEAREISRRRRPTTTPRTSRRSSRPSVRAAPRSPASPSPSSPPSRRRRCASAATMWSGRPPPWPRPGPGPPSGPTPSARRAREAGGHRGTFLKAADASLIGTMALVATVRQAVSAPVIAAGGIMDGRGVAAALALGAAGGHGHGLRCSPRRARSARPGGRP